MNEVRNGVRLRLHSCMRSMSLLLLNPIIDILKHDIDVHVMCVLLHHSTSLVAATPSHTPMHATCKYVYVINLQRRQNIEVK